MRSLLGRFHRPMSRGLVNNMLTMNNLGDGSTLSLDFTTMGGVLDPRLTFSRAGGGTYVGSDGYIYGVDSATSASLAIGTGSKSVTLTATAGVDRRFQVGQTVRFSNGANNMNGLVTAYNASTQVITIDAAVTTGSGSFTSWFVGNASPRFDYSPTNIGEPRGLLIEGSSINTLLNSQRIDSAAGGWFFGGSGTRITTPNYSTGPDGVALSATQLQLAQNASLKQLGGTNGTNNTVSIWAKSNTGFNQNMAFWTGSAASNKVITPQWQRFEAVVNFASLTAFDFYKPDAGDCDISIWGAQLEAGSGASSLIPTGASQVTRNGDSCVMTGTNFSSWFAGATEGVLFAEYEKPRSQSGNVAHDYSAVASKYNTGEGFIVYAGNSNFYPTSILWPTGGAVFAGGIATAIPSVTKQAAKWFGGNDVTMYSNGVVGTTAAGTGTLTLGMLSFGANSNFGTEATRDWLNACVRRVKFYPTALSNAAIQALTAP